MKSLFGSLGLAAAAILWGGSFVVVKDSADSVPVLYLLSFRYLIAVLGMGLLFFRRLKSLTLEAVREGAVLGALLFVSQFFQTLGCKYTTAGKNAFITAIYVVIVPFLCWGLEKEKPTGKNIVTALMALAGLGLLSFKGNEVFQIGDLLTLVCGVGLAFHIVFIDKYTQEHDPVLLTLLQFFFANLYSWAAVAAAGIPMPQGLFQGEILFSLLYLGIFSTMAGFLLQILCQKYVNPNAAAVILSMESVFGMLFSVIFLQEQVTAQLLAGCALMLAAVILAGVKRSGQDLRKSERVGKEFL